MGTSLQAHVDVGRASRLSAGVLGKLPQHASIFMYCFKMLPGASFRAPLRTGRWFTKGIRREPETMERCHEKDTRCQMKKGTD
jgi:hypothetical protein